MKKLFGILALSLLFGATAFATDVSVSTVPETLIHYADQAIADGKVSVDTFLTVMQTIHQQQKETVQSALSSGNLTTAQSTLNQWSEMYPLTTHLYNLKVGSGKTITNASGIAYTIKTQALLPRLNLSWGEEDFYAFPTYDTFLEVQWNRNQTGMLYQETSIISGDQQYFPHYFYGGKNTLSDLSWKDEGLRIMELKDENADNYFFFDLSNALADTQQFSIKLTSGGVLSGEDIFTTVSYSPDYFLTSLDTGFQFCQKVAKFMGSSVKTKEYAAKECSDAAKGIFYKGMHQDILKYAADLYL